MQLFLLIVTFFSFLVCGSVQAVEVGPASVHGFLSQGYMASSDYDFLADTDGGTFRFNEFGINATSNLNDHWRVGAQLVSRSLGVLQDNSDIQVDWGFLDYHWRDWLGLRVGKIKTSVALNTSVMDIDASRTPIIAPMSVYNFYLRDLMIAIKGATLYGAIDMEKKGDLEYSTYFGKMPFKVDAIFANYLRYSRGFNVSHANNEYFVGSNLRWNTPLNLTLNTSYFHAHNNEFSGTVADKGLSLNERLDISLISYGAEYIKDNVTLVAEYMSRDLDSESIITMPDGGLIKKESRSIMEGWYGQVAYRVIDPLEISIYYSVSYTDNRDRDGQKALSSGTISHDYQAWQKDFSISGRFDITDQWIVKLEGHLMDGTAFAMGPPNKRWWNVLAVKTTYTF